jgi:hypothetical protein
VLVYSGDVNGSSVLALLPDELPFTFQSLPPAEQAWRGRLFLMVWILYGHQAYSWSMALASGHEWEADMRRTVAETSDEYLAEAFAVAWEERRRW